MAKIEQKWRIEIAVSVNKGERNVKSRKKLGYGKQKLIGRKIKEDHWSKCFIQVITYGPTLFMQRQHASHNQPASQSSLNLLAKQHPLIKHSTIIPSSKESYRTKLAIQIATTTAASSPPNFSSLSVVGILSKH